MTNDTKKYPSGHGYEWRGDWGKRISHLLEQRGFRRLADYARSMPTATLDELADELGPGDVAPIQLQWILIDEAREAGELELCARDLMVRRLQGTKGWPDSQEWDAQEDVRHALIAWQVSLRDPTYDAIMAEMTKELLVSTDIAPEWKPSSADDQRIVALFERHWPR